MGPGHCLSSLPGASRSEGQLRMSCWRTAGKDRVCATALRTSVPYQAGLVQGMELAAVLCLASKSALGLALQTVAPCGCKCWISSQIYSPLWLYTKCANTLLSAALTMAVPMQAVPPGQHLCQLVCGEPALALLCAVVLWGELCHH